MPGDPEVQRAQNLVRQHGRAKLGRRSRAELLRRSLRAFTREAWPVLEPAAPLDWNWHLDALCDHLQALVEDWIRIQLAGRPRVDPDSREGAECRRLGLPLVDGRVAAAPVQRFQNLLVNVPPGTGKSRVVSVMLPAWTWDRWPSWRAMFLSVNPGAALRDSILCRELILSPWYQTTFAPDWKLSDDQDAKGLYKNTRGGWRKAAGYFSNVVGDRGDAEFIDDPNDPNEVHSEKVRSSTNNRFDDTLKNRVNDLRSSTRCVIQQRTHVADLSGHLLSTEPARWVHLRIPMERDTDGRGCDCPTCRAGMTPIGWRDPRKPGELMFPKRFPESVLTEERAKSFPWTSQYQQRPLPTAGNMFNPAWWRFWRHAWEPEVPELSARTVLLPARFSWKALSWDCSFRGTESSDPVAGGAWGGNGAESYLLDLEWDRMDIVGTLERLKAQAARHPEAKEVLVEARANGDAVVRLLRAEIRGLIAVEPEGGKTSRAAATAPQVEAGQVFLPLHAPWRDRYIAEHTAFDHGTHDDAVDQQSQLLLRRQGIPAGPMFLSKPGTMGQRRI